MAEEDYDGFVFESRPQRAIVGTLFIIVFVLGIFGNSLTVLAVAVSRKLQTATHVFVINLAVADLLTCLTLPWNITAMLGGKSERDPFNWPCAVAGGVLFVCVVASIYTLASIALSRYILITRMSLFRKVHRPVVLVLWVSVIWLIAFGVAIVPPIAGIGVLGYNPKYKTCSDISAEYVPGIESTQSYDIIQAVGTFPVPFGVITFCYISILLFVRKNARNLQLSRNDRPTSDVVETNVDDLTSSSKADAQEKRSSALRMSAPVDDTLPRKAANKKKPHTGSRVTSQEIRVTKNLFIVFCAFLICVLPLIVSLLYDDSDPFVPYATAILFFNSCVNPIIYATRFPNFKAIILLILKCRWSEIPEPSGLLTALSCSKA